jgi:hypothetical protein
MPYVHAQTSLIQARARADLEPFHSRLIIPYNTMGLVRTRACPSIRMWALTRG